VNKEEFLKLLDGDNSLMDKLREKYRKMCKNFEDLPQYYDYMIEEEDNLLSNIVEGMVKYKHYWEEKSEKRFNSVFKYWFLNNFRVDKIKE